MPSVKTIKIQEAVTKKPIKNEKRKSSANKYPLPSCDYAHTPNLDDDIVCRPVGRGVHVHPPFRLKLSMQSCVFTIVTNRI